MDLSGLRRLRRTIGLFEPDIIHCWGRAAARVVGLVSKLLRDCRAAFVVSAAAQEERGAARLLTPRIIRSASRVVVATRAEGNRYRSMGVAPERLTVIPPGVAVPPPPPDRDAFYREIGVPASARFIATAGRLELHAGMKAAVWAFDMVRYEFPELHLLIFGDGPDRAGIERFGRTLASDDFRVRFVGPRNDERSLLTFAEAVWAISDTEPVIRALEGMAAGRPVIAWDTPEMAEIIDDGSTAFLAAAGDPVQVASRTHALLRDPTLGSKVGAAGRALVKDRFGVAEMIARFTELYESLHAERRPG